MNSHWFRCTVYQLTLVLALFVTSSCDSQHNDATDAERYLAVSHSYLQSGQLRAALIEARNALQINPDLPEGHLAIARIQRVTGNYLAAIRTLEKIKSAHNSPEYVLLLADLYEKNHQPFNAIDLLTGNEKILFEQKPLYLNALAKAYFRAGDSVQSQTLYQQVLASNPQDVDAQIGMARLALRNDDVSTATQQLSTLLEKHPRHVEALFILGNISAGNGEHEKATELFTEALSALPSADTLTSERRELLEALTASLTRQGKTAEAYVYFNTLAELDPLTATFQQAMSEVQRMLSARQYADAENVLKELVSQYPSHPEVNQYLGILTLMRGDNVSAQKYLLHSRRLGYSDNREKALMAEVHMQARNHKLVLNMLEPEIKKGSDDPDINALYGLSLLGSGDSGGLAYIENALKARPDNAVLSTTLAGYYIDNHQQEKAITVLRNAYAVDSHNSEVYDALITTLIRGQLNQEAVDTVKQIIKDNPDDANAYALAGRVGYAVGDKNAAKTGFERALALDVNNLPALYGMAQLALHRSDSLEAIKHYHKIISLQPLAVNAYKGMIGAMEMANRGQDIKQQLLDYAETYPNNGVPEGVLAEYYLKKNEVDAAIEVLGTINNKVSGAEYVQQLKIIAFVTAGQEALRAGDADRALQYALEGLVDKPEEIRLNNIAVKASIALNQYNNADKYIDAFAEWHPDHYLVSEFKGDVQIHQGKARSALDFYIKAFNISPNDDTGLKIYRVLKVQPAQAAELKAFLDLWVQQLPDSLRALTLKASLLESNSEMREAIAVYESAQKLAPNDTFVMSALALLYDKEGLPGGYELAESAYRLNPDRYYTADALGWLLVKQGQFEAGLGYLQQALTLAPQSQQIQQHVAEAKQRQKQQAGN